MLDQSIDSLPSTSVITIRKFKSLGIETYEDLLNYFPNRYEDYRENTQKGEIVSAKQLYTRNRMRIQKFNLKTARGVIELTWFNRTFLMTLLKVGVHIAVAGPTEHIRDHWVMQPREYEVLKTPQQAIHTERLVPIYPEKRGLSSRTIREKVFYVLNHLMPNSREIEFLPKNIIKSNSLIDETLAYHNIHFPRNQQAAEEARKRLAFDELFTIQLSSILVRQEWEKEKTTAPLQLKKFEKQINEFIKSLPFKLTAAQDRVLSEILSDLGKTKPMNRFLQGEVGSGKTVVAAVAAHLTHLNGYKSLLMAPTEILTQQHYETFKKLFDRKKLVLSYITSSTKPTKEELEEADIVIGTHALIQKKINFKKVGLIVIDEQHRFGVSQRAELKRKGANPHLLTMTATPIPRTVALTLYGELDLSIIDEIPVGRLPVKTFFVPKIKRERGYHWIADKIKNDRAQVFIVCPLIDESEKETMQSLKAAKKEYETLSNEIFPQFSVALIHGRLKSAEKNQIMTDFKNKKYDILVATSVVEVGVDVPNATIMVIEGAERYGLAQLHQLRGRVGRGAAQSYCFLFSELENTAIAQRLQFFAKTASGADLAEYDLRKRGPGQIYGTIQHGYAELKIASLSDLEMISKAKNAAHDFIQNYQLNGFSELRTRLDKHKILAVTPD